MGKFSAHSAAEALHRAAVTAAGDRRRVRRLAWASAILIALPVLYALGRGPAPYQSQNTYIPATNYASLGEDVRPPVDATPPAAAVSEPAKAAPHLTPVPVKHDQYYCDFYAQAVTGNVTPEQASSRQQTSGAVTGALGGAVLGALFGGSSGHSSRHAMLGASAGLLAGAAMGSGYAQRAAEEVRARYNAAFNSCMNQSADTKG